MAIRISPIDSLTLGRFSILYSFAHPLFVSARPTMYRIDPLQEVSCLQINCDFNVLSVQNSRKLALLYRLRLALFGTAGLCFTKQRRTSGRNGSVANLIMYDFAQLSGHD